MHHTNVRIKMYILLLHETVLCKHHKAAKNSIAINMPKLRHAKHRVPRMCQEAYYLTKWSLIGLAQNEMKRTESNI